MTLGDCLRVLRTRWRIAASVAVLGVVVAGVIAILMPPSYEAKVDVFFTATDPTTNVADRVAGYAPLMTNDFVTSSAVNQLRLPETPQQFAQHVTVTSQPNSAVLTATVTRADPAQASAAANAVANSFIDLFGRLEVPPAPNTLPAVSAKLVQPAGPTVAATWPSSLTLAVGLAVGVVLGAAAAGVRHALDPRVRSRDELARLTGRPCLGEVTTRAGAIDTSSTAAATEFQRLRTVLRHVNPDAPPRTFTVSGATAVSGRTLVSFNLASALARGRAGVLLVETDLHRPEISHEMGLDGRTGLTSVLARRASPEQAVRRVGGDGLWVLPAGPAEDDAGDLLASPRMAELLSDVRERYDVVVLDTAPLLDEPSAVELASGTDGVVLLVDRGSTRKAAVREAVELLDQIATPIIGTVLTSPARRRDAAGKAPGAGAPTAVAVPSRSPSTDRPATPRPSAAASPWTVAYPARSSAPVETSDAAGTTAETPTRSLISLSAATRGADAESVRAEGHEETARTDQDQGARGDPAVPANENRPT